MRFLSEPLDVEPRQQVVVTALAAFALSRIANGAYSLPVLCTQLGAATGGRYSVDANLRDYPVFIWTKSGDPDRVKRLVATCLRAEWLKSTDGYTLSPIKAKPGAGLAEFSRQYKLACAGDTNKLSLPPKELFSMRIGSMIRYSYPQIGVAHPLPAQLRKSVLLSNINIGFITVMRQAEGIYYFRAGLPGSGSDGEVEFRSLPAQVESAFQQELSRTALSVNDLALLHSSIDNPSSMKIDLTDLTLHDPTAILASLIMPQVARQMNSDLVMALPDLTYFAVKSVAQRNERTVRAALEAFSGVLNWSVADDALVGILPLSEGLAISQVRRSALRQLVAKTGRNAVLSGDLLSNFVQADRVAAANCFADLTILAMAGTAVDDEFIADYPYNIRLWAELDRNDWTLMLGNQPFLASSFSSGAQAALIDLLVDSNHSLEARRVDPGLWRSLEPQSIRITPVRRDESVLIGWTGLTAQVLTVRSSAANFDLRRHELGRDPLYRPAARRKLSLTITSLLDGQSVDSGLSELIPDPKVGAVRWEQLPELISREFSQALQDRRNSVGHDQAANVPTRSAGEAPGGSLAWTAASVRGRPSSLVARQAGRF